MEPGLRRTSGAIILCCGLLGSILLPTDTVAAPTKPQYSSPRQPESVPIWLTTAEGCQILERLRDRAVINGLLVRMDVTTATVTSTVPCRNGKLDGEGSIRYFDNGRQYWEWEIAESRGVRVSAGVIVPVIDRSTVAVKSFNCTSASITLVAPSRLAYEMPFVWSELEAIARESWSESCNRPPLDRQYQFLWGVEGDGGPSPNPWLANNSRDSIRRDNGPESRYQRRWQNAENDVIASARRGAEQELARREAAERGARRQELAKKTGQFELVQLSEIAPNPFVWRGKVVGTCVMFAAMRTETTASVRGTGFVSATLTGVPTTRFRKEVVVFLVARVGAETGGGITLQYLAAIDQPRDDGCRDYIDR